MVSRVRRMNEVSARRARLVLGCVRAGIPSQYVTSQLGQLSLPGSLNRVSASTGVKTGMSPLSGGRQHCVILYGT